LFIKNEERRGKKSCVLFFFIQEENKETMYLKADSECFVGMFVFPDPAARLHTII